MNKINDGGPAFPGPEQNQYGEIVGAFDGMTLRDWFAGMAMQGIMSTCKPGQMIDFSEGQGDPRFVIGCAFRIADAMLKARGGDDG